MRASLFFFTTSLVAGAIVLACGDDTSQSASTDNPDTGTPSTTTPPSTTSPTPGGDASSDLDATTTEGDAGDPIAVCTSGSPSDAGAPVSIWTDTPPTPTPIATAPTIAATFTHGACTLTVESLLTAAAPPQYTSYLRKVGDQCAEAKGYAYLAAHSYAQPALVASAHPTDARLFAVAWAEKASPSGEIGPRTHLAQIDWFTGAPLHVALLSAAGIISPPQPLPQPLLPLPPFEVASPSISKLSIDGCSLIAGGTGTFPGATGTVTAARTFVATYDGFLAPFPQATSFAAKAVYQ